MKNRIFHNWALKVSSVVIAVVLWFVIYTIDDQPSTKYLYNVPVTFLNTEAITDDDKVYQVLDGTDVVRRITIKTTTSVSADLRDSDIKVEADFSKMKLDGTVELNIYSERHNDDITFKATSEELRLKVEDKVQKYLSLDSEMKGQLAEGYIIGADKLSPNRISVSGAESIMNTISKAVAVVDISGVSEDMFTYADIVLGCDESEDCLIKIDGELAEKLADKIIRKSKKLGIHSPKLVVPMEYRQIFFTLLSLYLNDITVLAHEEVGCLFKIDNLGDI